MGYCVTMDISNLTIPLEKAEKALKAINALHTRTAMVKNGATGGSYSGGKQTDMWYAWVNNPPEGGFKSLEDAFKAWRYEASNQDGVCVVEYFEGEKLGNCEVLWKALEKFVNPKATITCRGEDGAQWRWVFTGGKFKEQTAKVTWE